MLQFDEQFPRRILSIPLRIVFRPAPQIPTRVFQRMLGRPAQLLIGEGRVGGEVEHIARSASDDLIGHFSADGDAKGFDHLQDGTSSSGPEVPCSHARAAVAEIVERHEVAPGEVEDVDVIADGGAVFGGVVVAEDEQLLALADGDLCEEREQVVGDALGVFAHDARRVTPGRVEVPQQGAVPDGAVFSLFLELGPLCLDVIGDDVLDGGFGAAVRVCGADGADFGNRDHVGEARGVAVDGRGGGEDDVGDGVFGHGGEEADGAVDIGAVVFEGNFGRFAHSLEEKNGMSTRRIRCMGEHERTDLEGGKVDDIVDLGVLFEDRVKGSWHGHVDVVKGRTFSADELDAMDALLGGIGEIVGDDDVVAGFEEGECGEGSDVSRSAVLGSVG